MAHPHPPEAPERPRAPLPDRVTMPLLELITREAMDQDYAHAARLRAQRRTAPPGDGASRRRTALHGAAVVTAVFGLMIALAAVQTSRNAEVSRAGRATLVDRIDERKTEVRSAEGRIADLRTGNDQLRTLSGQLRSSLGEATVQLRQLEISTGFIAVSGPGVRITVNDSADGSADGRVRSTDLQLLVNGLWEAGAEAIAVNGRRLSVLTSITNSGIAINVNKTPLSPPYVVSAIGDEDTLSADELGTVSGAQFQTVAEQYDYRVARQNADELLLPSAPSSQLRLRFAREDSGRPDKQPGGPLDDQPSATPGGEEQP